MCRNAWSANSMLGLRTMPFLHRHHDAAMPEDVADDRRHEPISGRDVLMLLVGCSAWLVAFLFAIELFWLRYG